MERYTVVCQIPTICDCQPDLETYHCIDHLRQMVQCYGDVTIIPTKLRPGLGENYIDSDRFHTCRDFSAIREWTYARFLATPGTTWAERQREYEHQRISKAQSD